MSGTMVNEPCERVGASSQLAECKPSTLQQEPKIEYAFLCELTKMLFFHKVKEIGF